MLRANINTGYRKLRKVFYILIIITNIYNTDQAVVAHTLNPAPRRQRQTDL